MAKVRGLYALTSMMPIRAGAEADGIAIEVDGTFCSGTTKSAAACRYLYCYYVQLTIGMIDAGLTGCRGRGKVRQAAFFML